MPLKEAFGLKHTIYHHCCQLIHKKVVAVQHALNEVVASTQNETKSSAGDKYETGRAMLQIEQDNIRQQLQQALQQKAVLEKIGMDTGQTFIKRGSLVKTDKGYFFISIALGRLEVENFSVIAISPQSPLGSKLIGLKVGESITMNETTYAIESLE